VKELFVIGSRCGPFEKALALLQSGKLDLTALTTRMFPLSQVVDAIQFAQRRGVMKVLLRN
jgi:threonine dehydrogenase-like Zn-dependent dehydrogenase